jgi:hypothetical protein
MKVLMLHPEDALPQSYPVRWDLVIDIGRAPAGTYERWSKQAGCSVISIYDYAEETEDLYRLRELLRLGTGRVVDQWGIDWWEVLSLEIALDLQQLVLIHRLSKELHPKCALYSSRPQFLATAMQSVLKARLITLETRIQSVIHRSQHYQRMVSNLDAIQLLDVLENKFDGEHLIRRHFTRRGHVSGQPLILLPSAYINVSRTALSYAEMLPDHQFLLVHSRNNAKLTSLPKNVRSASLTPYFVCSDKQETASLIELWNSLRKELTAREEFNTANAVGVLGRVPALLRWGIALRDAWTQIFESENVTACLSADDSNPPSSIPLIMAKKRGLPALACHHGALSYMMAIKANYADFYLVKNEMERDYLKRICQVAPEKFVVAAPVRTKPSPLQCAARRRAPWLVFFTEPYASYGWRGDEVYRDLLPRLRSLAKACEMKLVFKLHPFETVKGCRKMLRRIISKHEREIEVLAGETSDRLWNNTRVALTVQSSVALECAALDIPVFLCAWLRDSYSGYVSQYARFNVGYVLTCPEQIAEIPGLLASGNGATFKQHAGSNEVASHELRQLFSGDYSLPAVSNA